MWHPDGYIELRDRKKDIIISGGENISTIEVEQAVARHPAVLECAVVADPGREVGRAAEGVRHAQARRSSATEAEIIEFCRAAHRALQVPGRDQFGDLPKTSTGKIQKFVLRDKEWGGRSKRINVSPPGAPEGCQLPSRSASSRRRLASRASASACRDRARGSSSRRRST